MVEVNDVFASVKDYARNQNLDLARGIRVINSAVNFIKAQISLPGQEREEDFEFFDDQNFYVVPSGFAEPISLRFDNDRYNQNNRFHFRPGELLFERVKNTTSGTRLWGTYYGTGVPQLMILAKNNTASIPIDTFDSETTVTWTATDDASNISYDPYTKKEGAASLAFDTAVNVANRASLTGSMAATDWSSVEDIGHFRLWVDLPTTTDFTSISINWGTGVGDYLKRTVTTQRDGSAFVAGWNEIDLPWDASVVQVGSPDLTALTYLKLDFDYEAGFVPQINWRVDYLRIGVPDEMRMNYYTTYVGKTAGGTLITTLTASSDVLLFGDIDPGLKELVALQAAIILNPQILVEDKSVRQMYSDFTMLYKRMYPRKKTNNLMADPTTSRTHY